MYMDRLVTFCMILTNMYSTDAIFRERRRVIQNDRLPFGNIQVRTSKDLVNWEFKGWAFDTAFHRKPGNGCWNTVEEGVQPIIWAPYIFEYKGIYA